VNVEGTERLLSAAARSGPASLRVPESGGRLRALARPHRGRRSQEPGRAYPRASGRPSRPSGATRAGAASRVLRPCPIYGPGDRR
jgi:hypothetical protein